MNMSKKRQKKDVVYAVLAGDRATQSEIINLDDARDDEYAETA